MSTLPWVPPSVPSRPALSWTTSRVLVRRWDFGVRLSGSWGLALILHLMQVCFYGLAWDFSLSVKLSAQTLTVLVQSLRVVTCINFCNYFSPVGNLARLTRHGTAAARAALPTPISVCSIFMCPNSVWDFWCMLRCWCMRLHTGAVQTL